MILYNSHLEEIQWIILITYYILSYVLIFRLFGTATATPTKIDLVLI